MKFKYKNTAQQSYRVFNQKVSNA